MCNECKRGHRGRGFESRYRSYSQSGLGAEYLLPEYDLELADKE